MMNIKLLRQGGPPEAKALINAWTDLPASQPCRKRPCVHLRDICIILLKQPLVQTLSSSFRRPQVFRMDDKSPTPACPSQTTSAHDDSSVETVSWRREWLRLRAQPQPSPRRHVRRGPRPGVTNPRRDGPPGSCPSSSSASLAMPAGL